MSLNTLNESLDIIANLVIPRLEDDVDVIQKLDDEPNDVGGLTAAELKAKFDEAANMIKRYLNETLVPQLSDTVAEAEVRAQAEAERIANERARVEGENLREEDEDARVQAEEGRAAAEQTRQTDEERRKTAETKRISAESTRKTDEQQRQSQESTRQANEETRQSQESTRQTNEQTRQTQEQARATAEAQRAVAEATRRNTFATELSQAQTARSAAEAAAKAADEDAQYVEETKDLSKSWAVGGTGTREGEDTNNAMYWSEQAKNYAGGGVTSEQAGEIASGKVAEHNSDEASHQDIRLAISGHLANQNNPHNVTAEQVGAIAAGAVGNLHVWERVQTLGAPSYELGTKANIDLVTSQYGGYSITLSVSDSVNVASDGEITQVNATSMTLDYSGDGTTYDSVKGKFVRYSESNAAYRGILFIPSDGTIKYSKSGFKYTAVNGQAVMLLPAGTHVDYLTSTDPNAYPKQSAEGGHDASYVLGDVVSDVVYLGFQNASVFAALEYADSVSVGDDGIVTLVNSTPINIGHGATNQADDIGNLIVGKFIAMSSNGSMTAGEPTLSVGKIVYIPDTATVSYELAEYQYTRGYFVLSKYQPVTGYPAIPANTVITYLGQLGEPGARIEVGSYVGTGTYGSSNPNTLTFGFEPKFVRINDPRFYCIFSWVNGASKIGISLDGNGAAQICFVESNGKTISWYSNSQYNQFNVGNETYHYIAIG